MKIQNAADAGISGLTPQLADSLKALTEMAQQVADTVRDGALPLSSFRAWIAASHIVHDSFGPAGEVAWGRASGLLADRLAADGAQQAGGERDNTQA